MTWQVYAINHEPITVSDDDMGRIGRGEPVGYSFGVVTDLDTGKHYEVRQANCGGDNCNCAATLAEVAT